MSQALVSESRRDYRSVGYPAEMRADMIAKICLRLMGGEALAAICRDAGMPSASAVWDWERTDELTREAIARARAIGEEAIALEATEIIDGKRPVAGVPPDPARDKARADVRLKLLAKFNPKRWGDSTQLRHADADGGKLDTAPLVGELLNLMPGATPTPAAQPTPSKAQVVERESSYRPRLKAQPADDVDDVDDLV